MLERNLRIPGARNVALIAAALAFGCAACGDDDAETSSSSDRSESSSGDGTRPADDVQPLPHEARTNSPPRLVLSIVVESLGAETLRRLLPALPEDGFFHRAIAEGLYVERARLPYASTYRAPGYALLYAGATPRVTGVVADAFPADPEAGVDAVEPAYLPDPLAVAAGEDEAVSVRAWLRSRTVADTLRVRSGGTAKIAALALDRLALVAGIGHGSGAAYAYDPLTGHFVPMGDETPLPVGDPHLDTTGRIREWRPRDTAHLARFAGSDHVEGEAEWLGLGVSFPHPIAQSDDTRSAFVITPASTEALLALSSRLIVGSRMGEDDIPDFMTVSVGATGWSARIFGDRSWEYLENLLALDRMLAELVDMLAERLPVAVLVTSDRGVPPLPESDSDHHRVDRVALRRAADDAMDVALGRRIAWIDRIVPPYVYMTRGAPFRMDEAVTAAIRALEERPEIARAYAVEHVPTARETRDAVDGLVRESVHPGRGGEIYVVLAPGYVWDDRPQLEGGVTGGSIADEVREIPIVAVGAGISHERVTEVVDARRYAPTLSALLGAPRPPDSRLPPLPGVRRSPAVGLRSFR